MAYVIESGSTMERIIGERRANGTSAGMPPSCVLYEHVEGVDSQSGAIKHAMDRCSLVQSCAVTYVSVRDCPANAPCAEPQPPVADVERAAYLLQLFMNVGMSIDMFWASPSDTRAFVLPHEKSKDTLWLLGKISERVDIARQHGEYARRVLYMYPPSAELLCAIAGGHFAFTEEKRFPLRLLDVATKYLREAPYEDALDYYAYAATSISALVASTGNPARHLTAVLRSRHVALSPPRAHQRKAVVDLDGPNEYLVRPDKGKSAETQRSVRTVVVSPVAQSRERPFFST